MEVSIFCAGLYTEFTNGERVRKKLGLGTKTRRVRINKEMSFPASAKLTQRPIGR